VQVHWIKISTAIFDDEKIKLIDALPDRDAVFTIWVKLLVLAGRINDSGKITMDEAMPYTDEMLSTVFNRPVNTIRLALDTFRRFRMIETLQGDVLFITNWDKHQNLDGMDKIREDTRVRNIKYREKKKLQLRDARVTQHDATESESESESEREEDKDNTMSGCPDDSMPYRMARLIYELHLVHDEKFLCGKKQETTFQRWAKDIDKLNRIDGREWHQVEMVIRWCQAPGCFWIPNILSGAKLREKFPVLIVQATTLHETAEEKRLRLCREEMAKV
jgi:predicted phage replisome organizer